MSDLEDAWAQVHAATPTGWYVGQPSHYSERGQWLQYAFDPSERPKVGLRSRAWEAVGTSELDAVREMARCLRDIRAGRVPR